MCQDAVLLQVLQASQEREVMWEPALQRGPLWKNIHYVEHNSCGELVRGTSGKPLCQELLINLTGPLGKLEYMPIDRGHPLPLTLAACHAELDDYLDLTETVTEMAHRLMKEDGQEVATPPKADTTPKKKEAAKDVRALVNVGITLVASDLFWVANDQAPLVITLSISAMLLMHQLWVCAPERTMILMMRPSYWATLVMPYKRWPPV